MELENTYELDLDGFVIYIGLEDYSLKEITMKNSDKKFTNKEFGKEDTWQLLFDLINSRLTSEALVMKMEDEKEDLIKDNQKLAKGLQESEQEIEELLEKYNQQVNFIEENRHKLEG